MDAFEQLVAGILRAEGYWVESNVRVKLSSEDKRALDNFSMPNPEVDLVAYRPATATLLVIECKSYFDSGGVHARDLKGGSQAQRYKMFVNSRLREMVFERLIEQLRRNGLIVGDVYPKLALAYGHATAHNEALIAQQAAEENWLLLGPQAIRAKVLAMADEPYDNQVGSVVAKLFRAELAPARLAPPVSLFTPTSATEAACQ
jgi:hypothetical protein